MSHISVGTLWPVALARSVGTTLLLTYGMEYRTNSGLPTLPFRDSLRLSDPPAILDLSTREDSEMHTLTLTTRQLEEMLVALDSCLDPDGMGPKWVVDLVKLLWDAEGEGE